MKHTIQRGDEPIIDREQWPGPEEISVFLNGTVIRVVQSSVEYDRYTRELIIISGIDQNGDKFHLFSEPDAYAPVDDADPTPECDKFFISWARDGDHDYRVGADSYA